jgi:nitrogen fixation/metabolism regulation signal transduction histidine kinase
MKNAQEALHDQASPRISVDTVLEGDLIALGVEDNGPGFPEELKNRMFEPYATTKPRGTGLGLPVVKKIIEEHHGTIEVRNLDGGGARICVRLPILVQTKG